MGKFTWNLCSAAIYPHACGTMNGLDLSAFFDLILRSDSAGDLQGICRPLCRELTLQFLGCLCSEGLGASFLCSMFHSPAVALLRSSCCLPGLHAGTRPGRPGTLCVPCGFVHLRQLSCLPLLSVVPCSVLSLWAVALQSFRVRAGCNAVSIPWAFALLPLLVVCRSSAPLL